MWNEIKKALGKKGAERIRSGMIVGLGSGSTSAYFIEALARRCREENLSIQAVASSKDSAERALNGGIPLVDLNAVSHVDLTVDGADEIDPQKRMIKGGGGAHVREKILASASRKVLILIDESKKVERLGKRQLPVEVLFFGSSSTRKKLEELGYAGSWRIRPDGTLFLTENGNPLFDIQFPSPTPSPEKEHLAILQVPGVIDTGFFFHLAHEVLIGHPDGTIQSW